MISALLFEVVSFLPLPSCKACVKETPTMLLGSPFLRRPQTRQLCPAGSMQLTFCYFSSIWVFFLLFLSEWLWPVSKGYAPIPITAISQPETSVQQVEFCGCCIPSCSAQNGERCRHAASARTVAFSLLPVAASQCEEHHCCSWRH